MMNQRDPIKADLVLAGLVSLLQESASIAFTIKYKRKNVMQQGTPN